MQGTIVMLMALSGLGCHHKSCAPAYTSACYSSCYSGNSCYSSVSYSSCYSGGSCYSDAGYSSCYAGKRRGYGLFGRRHRRGNCGCYAAAPVVDDCYGGGAPVYGSYTPAVWSAPAYATGHNWSAKEMPAAPMKSMPSGQNMMVPTKAMPAGQNWSAPAKSAPGMMSGMGQGKMSGSAPGMSGPAVVKPAMPAAPAAGADDAAPAVPTPSVKPVVPTTPPTPGLPGELRPKA